MATLELDLEAFRLLESKRDSVDESQLDILKRCLRAGTTKRPARPADAGPSAERHTGAFAVRVGKRETLAHSQKAAYKQVLLWLAEEEESFLDRLSNVRIRRRRIVATTPAGLYEREDLVRFAEKLCEGWYADLNLSGQQKLTRLREACKLTGRVLGRDIEPGFR